MRHQRGFRFNPLLPGPLRPLAEMHRWTGPRLNITFDMSGLELAILGPDVAAVFGLRRVGSAT